MVNIAFLGRVVRVKGLDLFLPDFKKALEKRKDIHLHVIGGGKEMKKIRKQVSSNNLDRHITFYGTMREPFSLLEEMDALVFTSRHEGQGMVVLEAKALGLDTIFPKRLEKYLNGEAIGSDDIVQSVLELKKKEKNRNDLQHYNNNIMTKLEEVFGE
jgi:glycosyltransferase involved in cell wall biosynthesis